MALAGLFAYVLLFVIKCRFPACKSFADIIRSRYGENILQKVRKLEKLDFKLRKCQLDTEFLEVCSTNSLVPNFLNFKVTNNLLRGSNTYRQCQVKLLKQEITNKKSLHRVKSREFNTVRNELVRTLTLVDFTHTITIFTNSNDKILRNVQKTHQKKLCSLGYCEKGKAANDPDQVIVNYSSYKLNDVEKTLLAKGLNFSLPPKVLNYADHMTPFELLYRDVKSSKLSTQDLDILRISIKGCAYSSFKRFDFMKELNLSKMEYDALKGLSSRSEIVIQKSDKGNSVVITNRDDYLKKMTDLVADRNKFEKLDVKDEKDYNFMVKEKRVVDSFLVMLHEKKSIDDGTKVKLTPDGPNPARLYGLPKIHKPLVDGLPKFRPIISQIGSPSYKIAKFLLQFITHVTTNEFTLKDSFEFCSMLNNQNHRLFMCSLDVDSLFTNVPLEETIDIIIKQIFGRKRKLQGIWKNDFRDMLLLTTKGTVFYFNGAYYRQIDGVAMGSPLGPALANAFLCFHERKWIDDCPPAYAPVFYARYVDDIFVLLHSIDHLNDLVEYFNSKHQNINFTSEKEENNSLAFLDVNVYRDQDKFVTSTHRKETFSGVYTNYSSFIATKYKHSLVSTLLHRCFVIVSSYELLHEEIVKLKEILKCNAYPEKLLDRIISKFLNKIFEKRDPVLTVERRVVRIILPFLGSVSLKVKEKLTRSIRSSIPTVNLQVVFKTSSRMSSWFKFKDVLPKSLISGVVYQYKCPRCNSRYIGSTFRYFEKRLEEHLHVSALTGKPLQGIQIWPPMDHTRKCQLVNTRDDFSIVCREPNRVLVRLKESLIINQLKPSLNTMIDNYRLHLFT